MLLNLPFNRIELLCVIIMYVCYYRGKLLILHYVVWLFLFHFSFDTFDTAFNLRLVKFICL